MEHSQFFIGLRKLFEKFPGIGPRQANRFIWALLDFTLDEQKALADAITALPSRMRRCDVCFRIFHVSDSEKTCSFCIFSSKRDRNMLMIIERDSDLLNIEKTGMYRGLYHVLGGALDPLQEQSIVRDRIKALYERLAKNAGEKTPGEIILALSPTKMG